MVPVCGPNLLWTAWIRYFQTAAAHNKNATQAVN